MITVIAEQSTRFDVVGFEPMEVLCGCGIADEEGVVLRGFEDLVGVVVGEVVHGR